MVRGRHAVVWLLVLAAHAGLVTAVWRGGSVRVFPPEVVWLEAMTAPDPVRAKPAPAAPHNLPPAMAPLQSVPLRPPPMTLTAPSPAPPTPVPMNRPAEVAPGPAVAPATPATPGGVSPSAPVASPGPTQSPRPAMEEWVLPNQSAAYLNNPPPAYPPVSKRLGEQGRVVVRVLIDDKGWPQQAELQTSSGYSRLDRAAIDAVMSWRYVAGQRGGRAQAMWFNVPITFDLKPSRD